MSSALATTLRRIGFAGESLDSFVIRAYVGILVIVALVMAGVFLSAGYRLGSIYAMAGICLAALIAERSVIRLTPTVEASTASLPFIFAGAVFGPLSAMVVGAVALAPEITRRDDPQPVLRWANWTATRAITAGLAGYVVWTISEPSPPKFTLILVAVLAACVVDACADLALGALITVVRRRDSVRDFLAALAPLLLASIPIYGPIIAVLAYAYRAISPWSAALFVVPAFAAQRFFLLYQQQRETAQELSAANERLERATFSFAAALVATLDARDRYTAGHSAAVAIYARDIAARLSLSEDEQRLAHLCGLVHDIGKIGLSAGLLEKPGALTLEERRQMEQHSEIGERILAKVEDYQEVATIVRHHHERVDGLGYPDRLQRAEIPLIARIIAVADAYNAMTSDRPYRDAMPSRVARLRLAQAVETQFDTSVVAAFEAVLAGASDEYRAGTEIGFRFEVQGDRLLVA